jgi:hypothetical protein
VKEAIVSLVKKMHEAKNPDGGSESGSGGSRKKTSSFLSQRSVDESMEEQYPGMEG